MLFVGKEASYHLHWAQLRWPYNQKGTLYKARFYNTILIIITGIGARIGGQEWSLESWGLQTDKGFYFLGNTARWNSTHLHNDTHISLLSPSWFKHHSLKSPRARFTWEQATAPQFYSLGAECLRHGQNKLCLRDCKGNLTRLSDLRCELFRFVIQLGCFALAGGTDWRMLDCR